MIQVRHLWLTRLEFEALAQIVFLFAIKKNNKQTQYTICIEAKTVPEVSDWSL